VCIYIYVYIDKQPPALRYNQGCFPFQDEGVDAVNGACSLERARRPDLSMTASRLESEEMTVSQLLQSLRNETQRAERLQAELRSSAAR